MGPGPIEHSLDRNRVLSLSLGDTPMTLTERVHRAHEEHGDAIYRHLVLYGISPEQAEELCQDCFLRLFQAWRKGQKILNDRAWLFRVAHNLAINHIEADQVKQRYLTGWIDSLVENRINPQLDPEQSILQQERFQRLHRAVAGLSPKQRYCLSLRAEGFRYREIAEIVGISVGSVVEYLGRAVSRLKKVNL
jgi:RNA polymerase sigma-70 factor, ECF subfamily